MTAIKTEPRYNGTPEEYADSYNKLIKLGYDVEILNTANHIGLEKSMITMAHFRAAANVLAKEIINR